MNLGLDDLWGMSYYNTSLMLNIEGKITLILRLCNVSVKFKRNILRMKRAIKMNKCVAFYNGCEDITTKTLWNTVFLWYSKSY